MSWGEAIFLKNFIKGEKRLVANDTTLDIAYDGSNYKSFLSKVDGAIRVKTTVKSTYYNISNFRIVLTNIDDATDVSSRQISISPDTTIEAHADFNIKPGKRYSVTITSSASVGGSVRLEYALFQGQVTDYNYFETEVI